MAVEAMPSDDDGSEEWGEDKTPVVLIPQREAKILTTDQLLFQKCMQRHFKSHTVLLYALLCVNLAGLVVSTYTFVYLLQTAPQ